MSRAYPGSVNAFFTVSVVGRGTGGVLAGAPALDFCSLALFGLGAALLAVAAYHLKRAPARADDPRAR